MMKRQFTLFILLFVFANISFAQKGFNYKAVIYDNGNPVKNQDVDVRFTILENGTAVYQETHFPTTDSNGIITVFLGEGTVNSGNFETINWSNSEFLKVEVDNGSGSFIEMSTTELKFVPKAKYAEKAGNVPTAISDLTNDAGYLTVEADADPTNELQTLSVSGNQLTISDGNVVTLPTGSGGDQWGSQTVESDATLSGEGTSASPLQVVGDLTDDQNLSLSGTDLSIANGNTVTFTGWDTDASDDFDGEFNSLSNVPAGLADGDDNTQLTETEVDNFVANNGYLTTEQDGDETNELQTISKNGNTVTLSNGGGSFTDTDTDTHLTESEVDAFVSNNGFLTAEADGDDTNELQTLSVSGNQLTITDGNTVTLPTGSGGDQWGSQVVESNATLSGDGTSGSPLQVVGDLTDNQNLSLSGTDLSIANGNTVAFTGWDTNSSDDFDGDFGSLTNVPAGLADGDDNTQLTETQVDNFVANNGYLTVEADGDDTNELQTISKTGSTVSLSNGGGSFTDADTHLTETQVDSYVANNGYLTTEADGDDTNELQTISKTGSTVSLSNGGGSFTDADTHLTETQVDNYVANNGYLTTEADGDDTNELQTLSVSGDQLSISDGNTITLPSSSGSSDADFLEVGTDASPDDVTDNIYHTGSISVGHSAASAAKVDIKNSGSGTSDTDVNALQILNDNSSDVKMIGVNTSMTSNGDGEQVAVQNHINGGGSGVHYAIKNTMTDFGSGDQFAVYNKTNVAGEGNHAGTYNEIIGEGSGTRTGTINKLLGLGTGIQTGEIIQITNTGDAAHYGVTTELSGSGAGLQVAVKNTMSNSGNGKHYGVYNDMSGTGTNQHYGVYTKVSGSGSGLQVGVSLNNYNSGGGSHYGVHNKIYGSGSGEHIGVKNELFGAGTGNQIAVRNLISNTNGANQYGVYSTLDANSGNGDRFAARNDLFGAGEGNLYGIRNQLSNTGSGVHSGVYNNVYGSGSGIHYGTRNRMGGTATGTQYATHNLIDNSSNASHYGNYTELNSDGNGIHYGSYTELSGGGSNIHYGSKINLTGSGSGTKYGVYSEVNSSAGGIHYALYAKAEKSGSFAGYFKGKVEIDGFLTTPFIATDKIVVGEVHGNASGSSADMKAYIYGNIDGNYAIPSIRTDGSSDGFSMSRVSEGRYKITMASATNANSYIVIATLNENANIWVNDKTSNSFVINIKSGLSYEDYDFQFVVYKK